MDILGYGKKHSFLSKLNPDECWTILAESPWKKRWTHDITGKKYGGKFQLFMKADMNTSSYNPVFYGKITADGKGSRIEGVFGLSVISLTATSLIYLWLIIMPILASKNNITGATGLIVFFALAIGSVITSVNLLWGKRKMKPIIELIQNEFQAIPITQ